MASELHRTTDIQLTSSRSDKELKVHTPRQRAPVVPCQCSIK